MNPLQIRKKVVAQLTKIKSKQGIYTFVSKPEDYFTVNKAIISYLTKNLKFCGVYISLNNSCKTMLDLFDKEKIDTKKLWFIESADKEQKSKIKNCVSLHSNQSLTELSLSISAACKNDMIKFIFLDSISTLLIYNNLETTERFVHYMVSKIRNLGFFAVLISIDEEKSNKLIPILSQFCDKIIKI